MSAIIEIDSDISQEIKKGSVYFEWLPGNTTHAPKTKYWHLLCKENEYKRTDAIEALKKQICEAHQDARDRLRQIEGYELDPYGNSNIPDPAKGYPEVFDEITLMGYFGEILTGLLVQEFNPFGISGWTIPAYLFRYHGDEFRHLEKIHQGNVDKGRKARRIGRTGDDNLAFCMDQNGNITHTLFCEAKCLQTSNESTIKGAHKKINEPSLIPLDRQQLIEVLLSSKRLDKDKWVLALRQLGQKPVSAYKKMNLVGYICGNAPSNKRSRTSWIPADRPHSDYKDKHHFQVFEAHIPNILDLVKQVYGK